MQELAGAEPVDGSPVVVVYFDNTLSLGELRDLCQRRGYRVCLFARDITPELFFQAREAGISSVLATSHSAEEIVSVLCAIAEGEFYFDPLLTEGNEHARTIHLTPREGHLIELLTQGLKNKEIAYQLGITEGTVKVYLSKLYQKVGAKDRFDLALYGLKNHGLASTAAGQSPAKSPDSKSDALRTLMTRMGPVRERRSAERAIVG
jgi:DNA-binding NarL/FixJ family response regulator